MQWQQSSFLKDCLVRIKSVYSFIYQLLEECTCTNFIKASMLVTFIRKQRHDNCLTCNCTLDSRFHVMDSMLIYLTWVSWAPLVTHQRVARMPKYFQASSLRNNSLIFNHFIHARILIENCRNKYKSHYLYFVVIFDTSVDVLRVFRLLSQITFDFTVLYTALYTTLFCDKLLNVPASFTNYMSYLQALHSQYIYIFKHSIYTALRKLLNNLIFISSFVILINKNETYSEIITIDLKFGSVTSYMLRFAPIISELLVWT